LNVEEVAGTFVVFSIGKRCRGSDFESRCVPDSLARLRFVIRNEPLSRERYLLNLPVVFILELAGGVVLLRPRGSSIHRKPYYSVQFITFGLIGMKRGAYRVDLDIVGTGLVGAAR